MGFNKQLAISMVLASIVFATFSAFIFGVALRNDVDIDPEYSDIFDEYEDIRETYETTNEILDGGNINPEGQDQAVYKNVIVAGKQAQEGSKLLIRLLNEVTKFLGIDVIIIAMISTLIFIGVAFGFLAMITKKDP